MARAILFFALWPSVEDLSIRQRKLDLSNLELVEVPKMVANQDKKWQDKELYIDSICTVGGSRSHSFVKLT